MPCPPSSYQLGGSRIDFMEYHKPGWTFHGKGLWLYLEHEKQSNKFDPDSDANCEHHPNTDINIHAHQSNEVTHNESQKLNLTSIGNSSFSTDGELPDGPILTLIGSPNFGKRSVFRDMEAQLGIISCDPRLKRDLIAERDRMAACTTIVHENTYAEEEREIKWWVWGIATFMNQLF